MDLNHAIKLIGLSIEKLSYPGRYMDRDEIFAHMIKATGEVRGLLVYIRSEVIEVNDKLNIKGSGD